MEIKEVKAERILNPTSIDLGEYVINPYRGCFYGCMYCYVQFSKTALKEKRPWGTYVDVRVNAPELLVKELEKRKPKRVLLGSTTECFGPYEKDYRLTKKILEILNSYGIFYSILTRSPMAEEYADILNKGFCENIYFTVNGVDERLKAVLEPASPALDLRINAINALIDEGVNVIPYFSPVLPSVSDTLKVFEAFPKAKRIDFETLNFNLGNIDRIIEAVGSVYAGAGSMYLKMKTDEAYYNEVWENIKCEIAVKAKEHKKAYSIFVHKLGAYFENKYT